MLNMMRLNVVYVCELMLGFEGIEGRGELTSVGLFEKIFVATPLRRNEIRGLEQRSEKKEYVYFYFYF